MNIISEIKKVVETSILPDGDHVNQPTQMWLERLINSDGSSFIPFIIVKSMIEKLQLGRKWCAICDSPDHECGCSPNVCERYRRELMNKLKKRKRIYSS